MFICERNVYKKNKRMRGGGYMKKNGKCTKVEM